MFLVIIFKKVNSKNKCFLREELGKRAINQEVYYLKKVTLPKFENEYNYDYPNYYTKLTKRLQKTLPITSKIFCLNDELALNNSKVIITSDNLISWSN